MEILKRVLSLILVMTQLVMMIGVLPARAADPASPNFVCGQDLNNNGYLGDAGEYQNCLVSTLKHSVPANPSCLAGYTMQANGACMKYEYAPMGSQCQAGYFIQNGRCVKEEFLQAQAYCPGGYVRVGDGCQAYSYTAPTQTCPAGSFIQDGQCVSQQQLQPTLSCPVVNGTEWERVGTDGCRMPGAMPVSGQGRCFNVPAGWELADCELFRQGPTTMFRTIVHAKYLCTTGSLVNGSCVVNNNAGAVQLTCPTGTVIENGQCKQTSITNLNYLCSMGSLVNGTQCHVVSDAGPVQAVCNAGYIIQNGQCVKSSTSATQYSCTNGTLAGTACVWNTSENYCPIGADQSCLNNNGGASCSPNKCIDITANKPVDEGNIDGTMLVDDGKKNDEGVCMDQLFIFGGRAQDCKLAGIDTAFQNCCKSQGKVFTDSVGALGSLSTAASTVSKLYGAAQEAYTYYTVAMQATGDVAVASSMAAQGFADAMVVAFNPATFAISVGMYFAMDYLMKACDQTSMETAMAAGSGFCHEVGTYCKKKIPLLGCVQKATSYCCFNSKLARIIHEQGRPQLTNFNGWGDAGSPQCRGFSPDEFQAVDFSKIDLSEYVEDMVKKATNEIQSDVNQITKDFYEKTN